MEILRVRYDEPAAQVLVTSALAELTVRYGGNGDDTPVDVAEFAPPAGDFLVAMLDGEPAGCAGWRSLPADPAAAELKRMFTEARFRGRGVASAVLTAVEGSARAAGRSRLILECGDRQPEAIALYEKRGYRRIPNFGYYKDYPDCRSYQADL